MELPCCNDRMGRRWRGCAGVAVDVLWQVLGVKRVVVWWW
jgi:hypothetical protein